MADVIRDVVLDAAPAGAVSGVYLKGSSVRPWESRIDYAPEVSDVDVHIRVRAAARSVTGTTDFAVHMARSIEEVFDERFPERVHTPRPQIFFLDDIEGLAGYLPSPDGAVVVLHGEAYTPGSPAAYRASAADDRARFLADAHFVANDLAGKVIDRPGRLAWQVVSTLTWRVAPTGPRLLNALGRDPHEVWGMNRTAIVGALRDDGAEAAAKAFADFYLAAWDGFESGFRTSAPALQAIDATLRLFAAGREIFAACETPTSDSHAAPGETS